MSKWKNILMIAIAFCVCPSTGQAEKLRITNVFCDPVVFEPGRGQTVKLTYRLSAPVKVSVKIYDPRNLLIRDLIQDIHQNAGDHSVLWDGKDNAGSPVPPNYYVYTIMANTAGGDAVLHDLTDLTGGKLLYAKKVGYDPATEKVSYVLPKHSLVNVRIGLPKGGPLLTTLIDWVPRKGGFNQEPWDGWDRSHSVNVAKNKHLQVGVSAYSLPLNSIIVTGQNTRKRPEFIQDISWGEEKRKEKGKKRKEIYNHWQHPRDKCYDPDISLSLPPDLLRNANNLPVITGPVPIRMEVAEKDRKFMLDQRFEVVYYVDFVFVYEEELGYTPFSWIWNPAGVNEGVHYITVMLRGYEGHFGTVTKKVLVDLVK